MNVGHGRTDFTLILDDDMTIGYGIRLFYKGLHPQAQTMDIIGYLLTVNNDTHESVIEFDLKKDLVSVDDIILETISDSKDLQYIVAVLTCTHVYRDELEHRKKLIEHAKSVAKDMGTLTEDQIKGILRGF